MLGGFFSHGPYIKLIKSLFTEENQILSDNTTNNVTSSKHGYTPKSPGNSSKFLNGAINPDYALVKDSDLSTSDITINNVSSTKHGFTPKSPGDTTKFLNGASTPSFEFVKDSDLSLSDIITNNVTISRHGFVPKAPNDPSQFLDGTGNFSTPAGASPGVGSFGTFLTTTAPANVLYANGSNVSRTTYATLWTWVQAHSEVYDGTGTNKEQFGPGDGSSTFTLPDWRGLALRMAGTNATFLMADGTTFFTGGTLMRIQNDMFQNHRVQIIMSALNDDFTGTFAGRTNNAFGDAGNGQQTSTAPISDGINGTPRVGKETRPAAIALNYGIYYV